MSSFGRLYKVTTFGESHCDSVGVVIDGCHSNLDLTENNKKDTLLKNIRRVFSRFMKNYFKRK